MSELFGKIWRVKNSIPAMRRDTDGYNFKYVNLADIEKVLIPTMETEGLGLFHKVEVQDGSNVLVTTVFEVSNIKSFTQSSLLIPADVQLKGQNPYQSLGSAITYFKRYNLSCIFDILGTDEDVDAMNAKGAGTPEPVAVDYVGKVRSLIDMGRKRANLERYFAEFSAKMSEEQKAEIIEIIKMVKE